MFRIQLSDFRCFASPPPVDVRPLTFLIGENSTGKTSFLAAVRQLVSSFRRSPQVNPFNREPYFLGGYDQIARVSGGRTGRAKKFSLSIMVDPGPSRRSQQDQTPDARLTKHTFTFVRGSPQPQVDQYKFESRDESVAVTFDAGKARAFLSSPTNSLDILLENAPTYALVRNDLSYLRYLFDQIVFEGRPTSATADQNAKMRELFPAIISDFRRSQAPLDRAVFATSPIRTQPRRTYTPSELPPSAEGADVPVELARRKTLQPEDWQDTRQQLANFGTESNLFEEIDIRLLGKRDGDPFQVLVKTGGPAVNLVDVGYGVSQALPIVYELQRSNKDIYLVQQPEVHLHPRAQAALGTLLSSLASPGKKYYVIETHSDYILDRVRIDIREGRISNDLVTFIYFERYHNEVIPRNIYLSKSGDILDAPRGFRSFFLAEHAALLGL